MEDRRGGEEERGGRKEGTEERKEKRKEKRKEERKEEARDTWPELYLNHTSDIVPY